MPLFLLAKIAKTLLSSLYYCPAKTVVTVNATIKLDDSSHYSHRCRPTGRDYSKAIERFRSAFLLVAIRNVLGFYLT